MWGCISTGGLDYPEGGLRQRLTWRSAPEPRVDLDNPPSPAIFSFAQRPWGSKSVARSHRAICVARQRRSVGRRDLQDDSADKPSIVRLVVRWSAGDGIAAESLQDHDNWRVNGTRNGVQIEVIVAPDGSVVTG